jgi:hypothetical protein
LKHGSNELKEHLAQQVVKYGGNFYQLYKVIDCESSWNPNAKNPNSTATGLAQFLDGTFDGYCGGNKDDPKAQIHCLVVAWSGNKQHWWSESEGCWKEWKKLLES